jgi:hypothetical protein
MEEDTSHPISFLGERLDDELPILLAAPPHRRVRMNTGLMESTMSFICPLRSDAKGSRVARMLISGRLVTRMCRFGLRKLTRVLTRSRTSSLGAGMPELLGHPST